MIIAPVFMPLSENRRRSGAAPQSIDKSNACLRGFFIALGTMLAVGAEPFVLLVYGKKWLPVIPVFRILLLFGVSKSVVSACPSIFFLKTGRGSIRAIPSSWRSSSGPLHSID